VLSNNFVTNEQWADFSSSGYWVEDGQQAGHDAPEEEGREVNDDSLHWFTSWEGTGGFHRYVAPWTYPGWTWIFYSLYDPNNNGEWCFKVGEATTKCVNGGFAKYANTVQIGTEAVDEAQPETSAKDLTVVQHLNGDWYTWNKASWKTFNSGWRNESAWMCVTGYGSTAGDINFATPNNLCGYE
jgi:hypothetical protein